MNKIEWLKKRMECITGTDSVIVMEGSNAFGKTYFDLLQEKRSKEIIEIPDNPYMEYGRIMEPVVRDAYTAMTGNEVEYFVNEFNFKNHKKYPFIGGSTDGVFLDFLYNQKGVLEIKTTSKKEIIKDWTWQGRHYMLSRNLQFCDFAILDRNADAISGIPPQKLHDDYFDRDDWTTKVIQESIKIERIERDKEIEKGMIEKYLEFWNLVEHPEIEVCSELSTQKAPNENIDFIVAQYNKINVFKKWLDEQQSFLKDKIVDFLGEKDEIKGYLYTANYKEKTQVRFDSAKFKIENPEVYAKYTNVCHYGKSLTIYPKKELKETSQQWLENTILILKNDLKLT